MARKAMFSAGSVIRLLLTSGTEVIESNINEPNYMCTNGLFTCIDPDCNTASDPIPVVGS